jgi:hypothetical protein
MGYWAVSIKPVTTREERMLIRILAILGIHGSSREESQILRIIIDYRESASILDTNPLFSESSVLERRPMQSTKNGRDMERNGGVDRKERRGEVVEKCNKCRKSTWSGMTWLFENT